MRTKTLVPTLSINYRSLLYRYRKNWYWFVLTLAVFLALAYVQLRYSVPEYTTTGTFIIEDPLDSDGVSARNLTQQLGYYDVQSIDDELNIIRSRTLMAEVVKNLGLNLQAVHEGKVRDTDLYKPSNFDLAPIDSLSSVDEKTTYGSAVLHGTSFRDLHFIRGNDTIPYELGEPFRLGNQYFAFRATAATDLNEVNEEGFTYHIKYRDPLDVAGGMVGRLKVRAEGQSNTVKMTYTDTDPDRAADVVNELINVYNEKTIRERSLTGEQTVAFIDSRLNYVSRQLNSVESSVAGLRRREGLVLDQSVRGADVLAQLNEADAQLSELEVRKSLIEDLRNSLNSGAEDYTPLTVTSEIVEGGMSSLIDKYNQLIFEREQNLEVATAENPVVFTYDERLTNLRQTLRRSVETIHRETSERAERIKARVKPLEARMNQMPEDERRLVQVLREQKIREGLFVYLMQKREEAALTVAAQIPNTRVIDPATPRRTPIAPKPMQTYILAIGMGLLLPGLSVFLREALDTKLQLERDLTEAVGLPVFGRIAKSSKKASIVVSRDNRSGVAEMFRLLRTNLSFMLPRDRSAVILLTSGVSGEGKTFVSSNLGYSLALGSRRTVLVGADLRKPRLSSALQSNDAPKTNAGLSSYLVGESAYEDLLLPTENDKLFYIQSGPIPPNPSELLLRKELGELIQRLKEDFDVVIIDSPPVGLVTDALLFKEFVDITMYVVRLGYTPKASLEVVADLGQKEKLPNIGLVVNGLEPTRDYGYGYAQGYYK